MDKPKLTALEHFIKVAYEAAARHPNPLARLDTALTDVVISRADPYLIIDSLLQTIPQIIAARVPLSQQEDIAGDVETRLSEALVAWELK